MRSIELFRSFHGERSLMARVTTPMALTADPGFRRQMAVYGSFAARGAGQIQVEFRSRPTANSALGLMKGRFSLHDQANQFGCCWGQRATGKLNNA